MGTSFDKKVVKGITGIFKKPKSPKRTAADLDLERRQRLEADELTRDENERLKAIKRGRQGRRTLLGSAGIRGRQQGPQGGGPSSGFAGVGGGARAGANAGGAAAARTILSRGVITGF